MGFWRVIPMLLALGGMSEGTEMQATPITILDFAQELEWRAVNDGVMGGLSSSGLKRADGAAVFAGELSLENNGGFASVRFPVQADLSGYWGIRLRVRGDGRTYQLRLRTDEYLDGIAYRASFTTTAGEWEEIALPFAAFEPSFRGRVVPGADPLAVDRIRQVTVMIADKRPGSFRLELDWLRALGSAPDET